MLGKFLSQFAHAVSRKWWSYRLTLTHHFYPTTHNLPCKQIVTKIIVKIVILTFSFSFIMKPPSTFKSKFFMQKLTFVEIPQWQTITFLWARSWSTFSKTHMRVVNKLSQVEYWKFKIFHLILFRTWVKFRFITKLMRVVYVSFSFSWITWLTHSLFIYSKIITKFFYSFTNLYMC